MAYTGRRAGGDVWRRGTEVAAGTGGQTQYAERAMAVLGSKFKVGTYFRKGVLVNKLTTYTSCSLASQTLSGGGESLV